MLSLQINKTFQNKSKDRIFKLDVSLEIKKNQLITIAGKSGSGKTTLLRLIAGLEIPDGGCIYCNEEVWFFSHCKSEFAKKEKRESKQSTKKINLIVQKRKIGYVFQDYALFDNMTVKENLLYALPKDKNSFFRRYFVNKDSIDRNKSTSAPKNRNSKRNELLKELDEMLELADIKYLVNRKTSSLSGGEKQRVALIRAVLRKPDVLLLDEPLSALDLQMRVKLQKFILDIHKKFHLTTILVSHDISEIMKMSDEIYFLNEGKIIKHISSNDFLFANSTGKFRFIAEVIQIEQDDIVCVLTLKIDNNMVKITALPEEVSAYSIGDRLIVASKAFNPVILGKAVV